MNTKIDSIHPKGDCYPLLVDFQNEFSNVGSIAAMRCHRMRAPGGEMRAIVEGGATLYEGAEKAEETSRTYIVARNKRSGRVRLIEVGRATLKAWLPERPDAGEAEATTVDRLATNERFGSKRQKRAAEQYGKMKVDVTATEDQLDNTVKNVSLEECYLNESVKLEDTSNATEYAPPADKGAARAEDVYSLERMASPELLGALSALAEAVMSGERDDAPVSTFAKSALAKLRRGDAECAKLRCSSLLYADALFCYLSADRRTMMRDSGYNPYEPSADIGWHVLSAFSAPNDAGRARSRSLQDRAICHAIVLALLANECIVPNLNEFAEAVRAPLKKVAQMARVVGARLVSRPDAEPGLVLRLPLAAPPALGERKAMKRKM